MSSSINPDSIGINLVIDRRDRQKREKIVGALRTVSLLLLFLVLGITITIFVLNINSPVPSLQKEQENLRKQLSASAAKEAEYTILTNRVGHIQSVITKRTDFSSSLSLIRQQFPSAISLNSLEVEKKEMSVLGSSQSLVAINASLGNMENLSGENKMFSNLVLENLGLDIKKGIYSFSLKSKGK